ncbi:DMT family transporter [Bradymonas sediminis]|nr:DMT family transporter [Bradymonas sediminis]TDP75362.1 putative membrane protein [Bradymonas sediminis]
MTQETPQNSTAPLFSVGLRYMAASAFFFSLMGVLVKVLGERLPSNEIVLARSFMLLLFAWLMIRRAGVSPWGNNKPLLFLRGLSGFAALSCFYYALTELPLADATLIMYINPVFTGILAAIFLKEAIGWPDIIGIAVSLLGVVLVAQPSFIFGGEGALNLFAVGVGMAGAILSAVAYVSVRKLRETDDNMTIVFYFPLVAAPASIPFAIPGFLIPVGWEWPMLAALGLVTFIAQVAMTRGLSLEPAGRATSISYLQVVFAFVWGMLLFQEFPDPLSIAGALLILASTVGVARWRSRRAG